jgi:hypothetical protein
LLLNILLFNISPKGKNKIQKGVGFLNPWKSPHLQREGQSTMWGDATKMATYPCVPLESEVAISNQNFYL